MHKFSYDFIKTGFISSQLFSLSNIITDLKAKLDERKGENKKLFESLEAIAVKESVEGSNAIEGIFTSEKRINELVEGNAIPLTHSEEEISGYHDAIRFLKENIDDLDFNEETVKKLHLLLVARHPGYRFGGQYKKADNIIAEKDSQGELKRVIFEPTPAKEVEEAMAKLFMAYQIARDDMDIPILLLIPCLVLDFLSIHPFSDGNGRVSRLLTLLLLGKNGYDIGKYISFEYQINEYKASYYSSLETSQKNWHENHSDYSSFVLFHFQILYQCYKELNKRFILTKKGKAKGKERIEAAILSSIIPTSKQDIHTLFPDVSLTTIELALSSLLKEGKIIKIGSFKDARYRKK